MATERKSFRKSKGAHNKNASMRNLKGKRQILTDEQTRQVMGGAAKKGIHCT